jgi:hypothetical protein
MRVSDLLVRALPTLACFAMLSFGLPDGPLPPAKDVVGRYHEALGGREAILKHTSTTMRGTLTIPGSPQALVFPFVYFARAPYQRLERVSLPNNGGDVLNGFDGERAWSFDPRTKTPQIYDGVERESMKRDADYYYSLDELSWFKSMDTVSEEEFEGRPCFRLHGVNNWNKSNDHFYDRDTGLLAGYEFASELGPTHEIFSDYQQLDGVLFPMKETVKVNANDGHGWVMRQVFTYTSVTFNDVDPAVFIPPQAVRDLLAKPHGSSPASK